MDLKSSSKKSILKDLWGSITRWKNGSSKDHGFIERSRSALEKEAESENVTALLYETQAAFEIENKHPTTPIYILLEISTYTKFIPETSLGWNKLLEQEILPENKGGSMTNHALVGGLCRILITFEDKKILREFEIEHRDSTYTFTFTDTEEIQFSYHNTIHQDFILSTKY